MENVNSSDYLGGMTTNNARRACEIKSMIAITKAAFNKEKILFMNKLDFK